jgi:hypothetical protein
VFSRENISALGLEMCTVLPKCSELTERRNTLKPDDLYVMQANACYEMTHGGRLTLEARDFANVFSCHSGLWFALKDSRMPCSKDPHAANIATPLGLSAVPASTP